MLLKEIPVEKHLSLLSRFRKACLPVKENREWLAHKSKPLYRKGDEEGRFLVAPTNTLANKTPRSKSQSRSH